MRSTLLSGILLCSFSYSYAQIEPQFEPVPRKEPFDISVFPYPAAAAAPQYEPLFGLKTESYYGHIESISVFRYDTRFWPGPGNTSERESPPLGGFEFTVDLLHIFRPNQTMQLTPSRTASTFDHD